MNETTLLSIKDFSRFTGVRQSTLRYYDEIGLLPPAARGENNYRYYVPFQIITLNFINVLIEMGVHLSDIKKMSKERTPESIIGLLSRQEALLDSRLNSLRSAYSIIHTYRDNIQEALLVSDCDVRLEELDEAKMILGPVNDFKGSDTFYEEFMRFCNKSPDYRINLRYPVGGYHNDMESYLSEPGRPQRFYSLDPTGNHTRKKGQYICGYIRGYYGEFGVLPEKMAAFADKHSLTFNGPVYVIYLLDEVSVVNTDQYLSKVMAGVIGKKLKKSRK